MFNRYIVVPLVVWAIAQFLKFVIAAARGQLDFKYLYASGGMPSVHSAVVTSLALTAFLVDGAHSAIFGLSIIFAAIVMYDSFGVRRSAGEHAIALNMILESIDRTKLPNPELHLREILGHRPLEVTVGAVLGLILGGILNYDKLTTLFDLLSTPVKLPIIYALAAVSALLLIGGIAARFYYLRRYKRVNVIESATRQGSWSAVLLGLIGLLLAFVQYEKVSASLWVVWPVLFALIVISAAATIWTMYRDRIPQALMTREAQAAKEKWFEGPNKKRRAKAARAKKRR